MRPREARLLLVDDDPLAIRAMGQILAQFPNKRFATSGSEGLRLAREHPPDLILLDAEMPGMSGFKLLDALQADPALACVPVIFATAHGAGEQEILALERGAVDFVSKPLVPAQVLARVRAQLRSRVDRQAMPAVQRRSPRVLVVDDDIAAIEMLRHAIAGIGDVYFARSGEEAMAQARKLQPDLILLDLRMPGMDGFAVCRALKAESALRHVPVVFVTRYGDTENETHALDIGAADFIAKPYSAAVLKARVRNLLELKRRTDADLRTAIEDGRRLADVRLADIVAAASDAIVTVDARERVVLMNAAAGRLFGVPEQAQLGFPVRGLVAEGLDPAAVPLRRTTRLLLKRHDGSSVPAEASAFGIGSGSQRLLTLVLRDVSDREHLESETRARLQAEAVLRTKTAMISYLAHELGNPLNGLLGLVELMTLDRENPLPPPQAQRLELMQQCGTQLRALLRDVLDLGRIESGKLAVVNGPLDPAQPVGEAFAAVAALAQQRGVELQTPPPSPPITVQGDPARLRQCLVNLLSNAVKYNRRGGQVAVQMSHSAEQAFIAVQDNGSGMDAEQRTRLFEPYNRLGRDDSVPGIGLGLMITQRLVEAMGGRLDVHSEAGVGSRFTIVLPRWAPTEPA